MMVKFDSGNISSNQSPFSFDTEGVYETILDQDKHNLNNNPISPTEVIVMSTILFLVFVASIVANAFVFVVFCKRKTLSVSNKFVANLTVCNCCNTFLVMPFAFSSLIAQEWVFGEFWCKCTGFFMNVNVSASIFTLVVISVDRYIAVVTPLHYSMWLTSRRCYAFIVCVWIVAIIISAPPMVGWNSIQFQLDRMVCTVKWSSDQNYDKYYTFFLISFSFLLPLLAMLWTYARMFRAARGNIVRARRNSVMRGNSSAGQPSPSEPTNEDGSQQQTTPINNRRRSSSVPIIRRLSQSSSRTASLLWRKEEWKAAVTSFLVLFSFALCWTPYFFVMGFEAVMCKPNSMYPIVSHISTVLALFSCACNPIVYVFRSKIVRQELSAIVRGRRSSGHEICVPHELNRRASVVRNESGRSIRSMGGLEEDTEAERTAEESRYVSRMKRLQDARLTALMGRPGLPSSTTASTLVTCSSTGSFVD